jgi:hypothetical protein
LDLTCNFIDDKCYVVQACIHSINNEGGGHGREVSQMIKMGDAVVIPDMVAITTLEP